MVTATLVPIVTFGFVDTLYLATEVAYRNLYTRVVASIRAGSYDKSAVYEMRARPDAGCVIWAIGSWSIVPYYALVVLYVIAILAGWPALLAERSKIAAYKTSTLIDQPTRDFIAAQLKAFATLTRRWG